MGLKEDIDEIKLMIKEAETNKKQKKFKLPFSSKVNKARGKKNFITILKINENGHINFKRTQIDDQTIIEDKIPRLAAAGYVLYWKGNPLIILPSWSVEPFSPLEHYQKSLINGSNTAGYRLLMAKMEREKVDKKPQMGSAIKWILGLGLVAIIGYALFTGGGA